MWRAVVVVCVLCLMALSTPSCQSSGVPLQERMARGVNGGSNCATCSIVLGLIYQLSEIHNETVVKAMERLCSFLPSQFKEPCDVAVDFLTPFLIQIITDEETPDAVCLSLGFCTTDPGHQTCRLWPKPKTDFNSAVKLRRALIEKITRTKLLEPSICKLPGIKEICAWVDTTIGHHLPSFDVDVDGFSNVQTLRGYSWRGADCNDDRSDVHPGTRPVDSDVTFDSNCNGIYGSDPTSTRPYEDVLCGGTQPRGIAVLGDSVGAHFHLPEEWFDSRKLSPKVFENLPFIIENEIDWPEMSSVTGTNHINCFYAKLHLSVLHTLLYSTSKCGLVLIIPCNIIKSFNIHSLRRNQLKDYPMLIIYSLVGNDVCNGHADTFAHMTTPQEMYDNALKTMLYLDKVLPPNSSVMMTGLAEGRFLYDSLHDRIHPIGRLHNDVTYPDLYDYFNCLEISPCTGWMNTNKTVRDMTSERAEQLSAALQDLANNNASLFTNFKLYYMECPLNIGFRFWAKYGLPTWKLIEPVDGFHDNQFGQALTAQIAWDYFEKNHPEILGSINPNNAEIERIFGQQGGYRN
ncbi:acyloxyacyl hydrolase-like [Gigantopelta aegis]|uniref:acyloxyacyl hydrolase-like n=1 Tax=Gigantopelta aegis TaxID=1735272 RepID=UPI001B88C5C0|nr:acyloxyacyl hydrolase-like [Gigantopelta aegis]